MPGGSYIAQDTVFHSRQPIRLRKSTVRSTTHSTTSTHLAVAPKGEGVVPLPGLPPASGGVVVLVSTAKTTALLAGGGKSTALAVLVDGLDDPVDAGITADGLVLGVDENDLVVLVGRVLVDPVRVKDAQVGAAAADTLFSGGLEGTLILELVDTLVGGLACDLLVSRTRVQLLKVNRTIGGTPRRQLLAKHSPSYCEVNVLGSGPLATSTADADTIDNVTLLGLVSEAASLVGTRWAAGAVDNLQLAKLLMHSQQCSTSTPRGPESSKL
jgi:hypothetical protein